MRTCWVVLMCLSVSTGFAQSGKGLATLSELPRLVAQNAARTTAPQSLELYVAKIVNVAGNPLVQVRLPSSVVVEGTKILPARLLPSRELRRSLESLSKPEPEQQPHMQLYVPESFKNDYKTVYRGLWLPSLGDLQNILEKGMEVHKSWFSVLYTSYNIGEALSYVFPYSCGRDMGVPFLPVMTKIPVTEYFFPSGGSDRLDYTEERTFRGDIRPESISDVVVFLEINGQAGWYKAVLEDGKLVLIPVQAAVIPGDLRWL